MQPTPRTSTCVFQAGLFDRLVQGLLDALGVGRHAARRHAAADDILLPRRAFLLRNLDQVINVPWPIHPFTFSSAMLGRLPRRDRAVINHRRGDAARADAARRQQRELAVRRRLARLDLRLVLDRGQHLVRPFDIAGGAHADDAGVLALGFEREEMVERGDAIHAAGRQLEPVGDEQQQVVLQVAEQLLRLVQHLDQRVLLELMLLDVRLKNLEALVAAGVLQHLGQPVLLLI